MPVGQGFIPEPARQFGNSFLDRFVGAEDQGQFVFQDKGEFLNDRGNRGIGRQAQHPVGCDVADMVTAVGEFAGCATIIMGRTDPQADAWAALDMTYLPDQHGRRKHPPVLAKTGGKVGDFDYRTTDIGQAGDEHGGVGEIALFGFDLVDEVNRTITVPRSGLVFLQ